jgi:hypothetical protein
MYLCNGVTVTLPNTGNSTRGKTVLAECIER